MIKKTIFDDPPRKIRTTCKISTFFEDLSFLNPRSHLEAFYYEKCFLFHLKSSFRSVLSVLKMFKFSPDFFGHVGKKLKVNLRKVKVNLKVYDITTWLTNKCNTHIAQYLKKYK